MHGAREPVWWVRRCGGGEPGDGCEGDGKDVFGVGGDGWEEVRGDGGCNIGDERGDECAGQFAKLKLGE